MTDPDRDDLKRLAARAAAGLVEDGMLIGLGTGSTVAFLLDALGERVAGGLRIRTVATSYATERRACALGLSVEPFAALSSVDLAIDGVDAIDPQLRAIKGGGGALLREKIVAQAAGRMVAIADSHKCVDQLAGPVPLEVLSFGIGFVTRRVTELGGMPRRREGERTDQGNALLDCDFGRIADPQALALELQAIPGVMAQGLFLGEVDTLCVAGPDGIRWIDKRIAA